MSFKIPIFFFLLTIFIGVHLSNGLDGLEGIFGLPLDDTARLLAANIGGGNNLRLENGQPLAGGNGGGLIGPNGGEGRRRVKRDDPPPPPSLEKQAEIILDLLRGNLSTQVCNFTFAQIGSKGADVANEDVEKLFDALKKKNDTSNLDQILEKIQMETSANEEIKEKMAGKEMFERNGSAMGLPGFPSSAGSDGIATLIRIKPSEPNSNMNIVEYGNLEMTTQLLEYANNDDALRRIIKLGDSFKENGGFVKSQVRFARSLHCIQEITNKLNKSMGSEQNQANGKVQYAIGGVWLGGTNAKVDSNNGQGIFDKMKEMAELKAKITGLVNNPDPNNAFRYTADQLVAIRSARKEMATAFEALGKFEQQGGGSSMDLMGVIWIVGANDDNDKLKFFFNIRANNTYEGTEEKDYV